MFHAKGSLEAELWVLDRTLRIPFGRVGQVVKGLRQSVTKRGLLGAKRKTLMGVADYYLYRNRARPRYDEYLAQGWPIASGPVIWRVILNLRKAKTPAKPMTPTLAAYRSRVLCRWLRHLCRIVKAERDFGDFSRRDGDRV
jgi:hypothetical protein